MLIGQTASGIEVARDHGSGLFTELGNLSFCLPAEHRGGVTRSSDEAAVMAVKQRVSWIQVLPITNWQQDE